MEPCYEQIAYEAYTKAVGGVAWNGDKLPTWEEFCKDPTKLKQVQGWCNAAQAVLVAAGVK